MTISKKLLITMISVIAALAIACGVLLTLTLVNRNQDNTTDDPTATAGPEAGAYYFDAGAEEYTLTLNAGNTFALYMRGNTYFGKYTLAGDLITLDFNGDAMANATATLDGEVITLTLDGSAVRFLKKTAHTVTFNTVGGSEMAPVTVQNGKTLSVPADPTRDNYVFVGWYTDAEYKNAFAFGTAAITESITLYARWSEDLQGGAEYTVHFDLNYENSENPADLTTKGGAIISLPTPTRDGFDFAGWWYSMTDNGAELSYVYREGAILGGNTTLYALWTPVTDSRVIPAPLVSVSPNSVSWNSVTGARSYELTVVDSDGVTVFSEATAATTVNVPFSAWDAGKYEITVVALASSGDANNSFSVRYFINKALARVTDFSVVGSVLIYNAIENAEKYLVTVVCGNPDHRHEAFDNGSSKTFNFANCTMPREGIRFTVTAVADGYASSTSREFVYKNALDPVSGFVYDEAAESVSFAEVENAAYYMVSVKCGSSAHNHGFVYNGTSTTVSLKGCDPREGGIIVSVYPVTDGYYSPSASEFTVQKTTIAAPDDIRVIGTTLSWSAVNGATGYEVYINGTKHETSDSTLDLSAIISGAEGDSYEIRIRALGEFASVYSDTVISTHYEFSTAPKYSAGILTYPPVIGAVAYEIQVNDGEIIRIEDGSTSVKITLTRAGENTVKARFTDGLNPSDWYTVKVFAHEVIFDSCGGSGFAPVYLAVGDPIALPAPERFNYEFVAWYNAPGGPAVNARPYTDTVFSGTGAIVLYAYYTPVKLNVSYNYGVGGTGDKLSDSVPYEGHYQLAVPKPNNDATVFGGWFTAPYGVGVQLTDAKGNSLSPWYDPEGGEVFAYWIDEALSFTLTKVNGRDAYMVSAGQRIALLSEVTVPASYNGIPVAMIAGNAFKDCTSIKILNIPSTVEVISVVDPFYGCVSLEQINVYDAGNSNPRLWSQDGVLFDNGSGSSTGARLAFMPLAKTGTYRIPDGITEIPEAAFAGSGLSKIIIPATVTRIGNDAFKDCARLNTVVFAIGSNAAPLAIGDRAFGGCTSLTELALPARLESISLSKFVLNGDVLNTEEPAYAFVGCTSLARITVAKGNKVYSAQDGMLFSADKKTLLYCPNSKTGELVIPTGTTEIAAGAFIGCDGITSVTLPNTLTLVGDYAFYGTGIAAVTALKNAFNPMTIGRYAFANCLNLSSVVAQEGSRLSVIGEGAFYGCTGITSFTVPAATTLIGVKAFGECTSLSEIFFEETVNVLEFGENAFYNCTSLSSISLPANVSKIPGIFNGCNNLSSIEISKDSPYFTSEGGVVFNKQVTEIVFFPRAKSGNYTIPATVTKIADGAFANVTGLPTLTVYTTLTEIGNEAFYQAKIAGITFVNHETLPAADSLTVGDYAFAEAQVGKSSPYSPITLPDSTTKIGEYAFYKTKHNTFSFGNAKIESIGAHAFEQNEYLDVTYSSATSPFVIPDTVREIAPYTFKGSDIKYIRIGSGVTSIGEFAFDSCDLLEEIYIPAAVTAIERHAFSGAKKLKTVTFAEDSRLEKIGVMAFGGIGTDYSYKFTAIEIPASVNDIGALAFGNSVNLAEVIFLESENESTAKGLVLGSGGFYVNSLGQEVYAIGHVFAHENQNKALKNVVLPARLVEIGEYTFYKTGATGATVTIPDGCRLELIGAHAFEGSAFTGEITLPASVQNKAPTTEGGISYDRLGVGAYAFYQSRFSKIVFASGGSAPITIGEMAFGKCNNLTEIVLPARLDSYTSHTGDIIDPLQGGAEVFGAGDRMYNNTKTHACEKLVSIGAEAVDGALYVGIDGILYRTDGKNPTELILCPISHDSAVEIPATVTKIHDLAFFNCTKLPSVRFAGGSADMTIGARAFYGCSLLTDLVLPDNVVNIGSQAFASCSALTSVTLSARLRDFEPTMFDGCRLIVNVSVGESGVGENYTSLDGILFTADMTSLAYYPPKHDASVFTIPGSVKVIGANTFASNSFLKEVILGEGIVEIRDGAFASSSITKITISSTVTLIGDRAFYACKALNSIVFTDDSDTPLIIGDEAFMNSGLKTIEFPSRVVAIGNKAFYQTVSGGLTSVSFAPDSRLMTIGDSAFERNSFTTVNLPAGMTSLGNKVFYECMALTTVSFGEGLESIGDSTFALCTRIVEVNFPSSLRKMGVNTFFYSSSSSNTCKNLKRVSFGENSQLEEIPAGTFAYTGLTEFVVPASVRAITYYDILNNHGNSTPGAFEKCSSLTSLTFETGARCSTVGAYAFYYASGLKSVELAPSVSKLAEYSFGYSGIMQITIPATCTNFGAYAFTRCTSLTTVVMDSRATALPEYMFYDCSALANITIPDTVTSIGTECFRGCAITEITIPQSVVDLGASNIFYGCSSLVSVNIDSAAKVLGEGMFYNCSALSSVSLSNSIETISSDVFYGCNSLSSITLGASVANINGAFTSSAIAEYKVAEGNTALAAHDGVLYTADKTKILAYPARRTAASITLPKELTEIPASTFRGVTSLQTVIFEEGSDTPLVIGAEAFYGCTSLTEINLPARLFSIGSSAFYNCKSLTSICLPEGLTSIGSNAFQNCNILEVGNFSKAITVSLNDSASKNGYLMQKAIYLYTADGGWLKEGSAITEIADGGKRLTVDNGSAVMSFGDEAWLLLYVGSATEITVPAGVTRISDGVFKGLTSITSVTLPETVTYIGAEAFSGCNKLKSVNVPDSVTAIGEKAFYNCKALTSVNIPNGVTAIGDNTFYYCQSLTSVTIPASVKSIGYRAFYSCDGMTELLLNEGLEVIGEQAFNYCEELTTVTIPGTVTEIGQNAFLNCKAITAINVHCTADTLPSGWNAKAFNKTSSAKHNVVYLGNEE